MFTSIFILEIDSTILWTFWHLNSYDSSTEMEDFFEIIISEVTLTESEVFETKHAMLKRIYFNVSVIILLYDQYEYDQKILPNKHYHI